MYKGNCLVFALLLCGLVIISGCHTQLTKQELNEMSEKIEEEYTLPYMKDGGISLGLFNLNGEIEETQSFNIQKGDSFKKIISVGNMIDTEREYKIILFVDYKQCDFTADGQIGSEYNFKVGNHEKALIPIEINDLQEGFHDIFFIIVKYPDIKSLDEDFRMSTDMGNLLFIRFNVLVNSDTLPTFIFTKFDNATPTVFDGLLLSKEKDKLQVWLSEEAIYKDTVDFNIHVGNETYSEEQEFAVVTLLDWKQVDFYNNQEVVFFTVDNGEKIYIPASINVPNNQGINDLVSILIHNPYEPLDIYNKDIETGIRIGINVRQ